MPELGVKTLLQILEFHFEDEAEDDDHFAEMVAEAEASADAILYELVNEYDWYYLYDALGCYPCRTRQQEALYQVASGMMSLMSYKLLRHDEPARYDEFVNSPADKIPVELSEQLGHVEV